MRSRALSQRLPFAIAAVLLLLLAVLAVLQWRWIGEVSTLEQQRLQSSLTTAGFRFTHDFDREIARAFLYFHPGPTQPSQDRLERVLRQYRHWISEAPYPRLIRDVFLVRPVESGDPAIQILRPAEQRFEPCPWPADLAGVKRRVVGGMHSLPEKPPGPSPGGTGGFDMDLWVDGDAPALVVPLAFFRGPQPRGARRAGDPFADDLLVLRFDRDVISREILPALARQHFETPEGSDYALAVVDAHDPNRVLFRSDPKIPMAAFDHGDLSLGFLGLRAFEELRRLEGRPEGNVEEGPRQHPHFPFWRHRRPEPPPDGRHEPGGEWRLVAKRRDGSLEQAVLAIRHRNLAVSLGILGLLAVTTGILVVATQRAQRLARLQIELVAGVTHELHTPLTAIRSAGQNLADGVVAEPAQVRRYGALIEGEGRRLSDLVGQALEFAGIQSGRRVYHPRPVEAGEIVDGALADCRWRLQEKRVEVERDLEAGLPPLLADPAALRRAVANLIENAVKYGGRPGWIGIQARREPSGQVQITVSDRGPGIRKEDLPHLFEPFFRGRDAATGGIPGSGLGLSLVRHIAEAHGGQVTVAAGAAGEGSAFTLHLPVAESRATGLETVEEPA
ncbi:MAG TPA: HAMP domain-containing sensor histidine kinase [Thermoanaerobaculia bacterium]|jgi:signal transduction histidine kinase|nr:HAMP domain-containing sensor histidine kinase [Thermoanaerobaculia bacterium]